MLRLRWKNHPNTFVVLPTVGDGSCALHAVVQGFHPGYQAGRNPDGTPINRASFIRELRSDLAEMLNKPSDGEGSLSWYDKLSRGKLEEFANAIKEVRDGETPDLTREGFAAHLRSNGWLGQEIMEYVGRVVGIAIFVLYEDATGETQGLYPLGKEDDLYYKGHNVAVIIVSHANKHFSTVGRLEEDSSIRTCFNIDDPLIQKFLTDLRQ
jgi:hypothetical protein